MCLSLHFESENKRYGCYEFLLANPSKEAIATCDFPALVEEFETLNKMKKGQIQELLLSQGLPYSGNKHQIILRWLTYLNDSGNMCH